MRKAGFNGIDGRTGLSLPVPGSEEDFARWIHDEPLNRKALRDARWWVSRFGIDDRNREPAQDVNPRDLASAGWGVIFAPGIGSQAKANLKPLLDRRIGRAGAYFKAYDYQPGQTKEDFLAFHKACPGAANPRRGGGVPYYLLIVGSPEEIPFRFQYELDMQYAVGRIHFMDDEGYGAYAQNVVEAERAAEQGSAALPAKKLVLFGVCTQGDVATERSTQELLEPLTKVLQEDRPGLSLRLQTGAQATKEHLSHLLGGNETPTLLLTASHGLSFSCDDPLQRSHQGALLCQDWPGEGHPVLPEYAFSGDDLGPDANLRGLIAFHFACYSGGTPEANNFAEPSTGKPKRIAPTPFLSHLAQRLLSHRQGALAVVGHVDRAWSTSFNWSEPGQVHIFENTFKRLLDGHPLGSAMEFFNQRHAELSVTYSELCQDRANLVKVDSSLFSRVFRGNNDARNFVVLGDPAVRSLLQVPRPAADEVEKKEHSMGKGV